MPESLNVGLFARLPGSRSLFAFIFTSLCRIFIRFQLLLSC